MKKAIAVLCLMFSLNANADSNLMNSLIIGASAIAIGNMIYYNTHPPVYVPQYQPVYVTPPVYVQPRRICYWVPIYDQYGRQVSVYEECRYGY